MMKKHVQKHNWKNHKPACNSPNMKCKINRIKNGKTIGIFFLVFEGETMDGLKATYRV